MSAQMKAAEDEAEAGKRALRLWLRMLACENIVEHALRTRLRERFEVTLPQFDALAELERAGRALTMSELSQELMVSNGNITGVVDRLVRDGYVERSPSPTDRRVQYIGLTNDGAKRFAAMASAHEDWVAELLGGLSQKETEQMTRLLKKMQASVAPLREGNSEP